jgi:hypothetical protein
MIRKLHLPVIMTLIVIASGCVKETYDMKMLSKKAQLSPSLAISALKGNIAFSDIVEPGDTVVYGQDKSIKLVFKEDSVIDLRMADLYDLNQMVSFTKSYAIGDVNINPFSTAHNFLLRDLANSLAEPLRSSFLALDDQNRQFPAFPQVALPETAFPLITNLEYATFKSGTVEFSVMNNLGAPLDGFTISLFNTSGHVLIGTTSSSGSIPSGATGTASIDLAGKTVNNSITAAITLNGSTGNTTPSVIDLDSRNIVASINGKNLTVSSGKVIFPSQTITVSNNSDVITLDPGDGIELDEIKVKKGTINYNITAPFTAAGTLNFSLPTTLKNSAVVSSTIPVNGMNTTGTISVDNTVFDLGTNPAKPFNELPFTYSFTISSKGSMVVLNSATALTLNLTLPDPEFDYVKGYFGKQTQTLENDIMDLDIDDILNHITGTFLVASPSIKLNYSNSFSVPMKIDLNATGSKGTQKVELGLDSISIAYPQYPARDITSSFVIDKNNSSLPQLISLPPSQIEFSGAAVANPSGKNRDNYIYGDSRFIGSLEVEVPMEFRFNNFQFADTVDNFLQSDDAGDSDNPLDPENFNLLRINLKVQNGFPFGLSATMSLYNPVTRTVLRKIDANDLLKPAAVDGNGKVTGAVESTTTLDFTKDFFKDINKADQIIIIFRLNTPGTTPAKFYSDYRIRFNASLVWKPGINIDLK